MVHSHPDPYTDQLIPTSRLDVSLGVDCASEEGQQDGGDVSDGSDHERLSATIDSGHQGSLALLTLGNVVRTEEGASLGEKVVGIVGAERQVSNDLLDI